MRVRVELDSDFEEPEVVIKARNYSGQIEELKNLIENDFVEPMKLSFYKDSTQYYLNIDSIIFFETNDRSVVAHTENDAFEVRERLYKLETELPQKFIRISKSTIVNVTKILSLNRSLSNCLIQFYDTHKEVYASRRYYKFLQERLDRVR